MFVSWNISSDSDVRLLGGWLAPQTNFAEYFSDFSRVFLGVCQLYFSASAGGLLGCSSRWQEEAGEGAAAQRQFGGKTSPSGTTLMPPCPNLFSDFNYFSDFVICIS